MLKKIKDWLNKQFDKLYDWLIKQNQARLAQCKKERIFWLLLKNKVPGLQMIYGLRQYGGYRLMIQMQLEPEYGKENIWIKMKNNGLCIMSKSLKEKDMLDALMKAAQWDDIICKVPNRFVPMLKGKTELEILKKGTTFEQLEIAFDYLNGMP